MEMVYNENWDGNNHDEYLEPQLESQVYNITPSYRSFESVGKIYISNNFWHRAFSKIDIIQLEINIQKYNLIW